MGEFFDKAKEKIKEGKGELSDEQVKKGQGLIEEEKGKIKEKVDRQADEAQKDIQKEPPKQA